MNTGKSIAVLNTLLETNNDRIAGYEIAIKETEDGDLKILFSHFKQTSKQCRHGLVSEIVQLGGTPAEGTKASGQLYRVWMEFKAKLAGNDRLSILNFCEHGEDLALETYDKVLRNNLEDITPEQQNMLSVQHTAIKAEREQVKDMKNMFAQRR